LRHNESLIFFVEVTIFGAGVGSYIDDVCVKSKTRKTYFWHYLIIRLQLTERTLIANVFRTKKNIFEQN
jgi:uncharacterized membrane protein YsdA (DUF1294 family)